MSLESASILDTLGRSERISHLAHSLRELLLLPLPPEALPSLARIAGVIELEACESAETLADGLGTEPAHARQGMPVH